MTPKAYSNKLSVLAFAAALVAGAAGITHYSSGNVHAADSATANSAALRQTLPNFSGLVEQVKAAVVQIHATREASAPMAVPGMPKFEDKDGNPLMPFAPPGGPDEDRPAEGSGSGFIVSADGYVLTNAHVVAKATDVTVILEDEREFKAKVVGSDRRTDVALLKIDAKDLPVVKIGDPSKTKVGDWVAAIGAPFGFDQTVTAGIVSGKSRQLPSESYVPFIQTDVAVNPGNSGGPLFNLDGEVIGINSQIFSRTGGYMGLSFAIPVDVAMKVQEQLQQYGYVTRGKLGVVVQDLNKELAESFGLKKGAGALVSSVEPGAPAAAAGIVAGDVVVKVNTKAVGKAADLSRTIADMKPGQSANVQVLRSGETKDFTVTLVELPAERMAKRNAVSANPAVWWLSKQPAPPLAPASRRAT
jgi:serine protease Do